jgi:hypothetical protein
VSVFEPEIRHTADAAYRGVVAVIGAAAHSSHLREVLSARMNVADVRRLYAYDDWANDRLVAALAGLSEEQFTRKIVSSFSSVRDTLSHIAATEWIWLQRWTGTSPLQPPGSDDQWCSLYSVMIERTTS